MISITDYWIRKMVTALFLGGVEQQHFFVLFSQSHKCRESDAPIMRDILG
jgi:hypothetical protein